MTAPVSIAEFARVVLPWDKLDGGIAMLTAYFDDSGTHTSSDAVVVAGVIGNQYQWEAVSKAWAAKLKNPSPGKSPLTKFHRVDCDNSTGEFSGWSRVATDFLVRELSDIVINSLIWCYGCAISRKDWDELIVGPNRDANGDAEGFALRACYLQSLQIARKLFAGEVAFVFDDRPHREAENRFLFDLFRGFGEVPPGLPRPISLTFALASKMLPLQAADLVAWELNRHSRRVFAGDQVALEDSFGSLAHLYKSGRFMVQIGRREEVETIASSQHEDLELVAAEFAEGIARRKAKRT